MHNFNLSEFDIENLKYNENQLRKKLGELGINQPEFVSIEEFHHFDYFPYQNWDNEFRSIVDFLRRNEKEEVKAALEKFDQYESWVLRHTGKIPVYGFFYSSVDEEVDLKSRTVIANPSTYVEADREKELKKTEKILLNSTVSSQFKKIQLKKIFEPSINYIELIEVLLLEVNNEKENLLRPIEKVISSMITPLVMEYNLETQKIKIDAQTKKTRRR